MSELVRQLRSELTELADVIETIEEEVAAAGDPFPWELSLHGLQARRSELVSRLEVELARAQAAKLAVEVAGDPVTDAEIDVKFLGEFLVRTQKLVSAIGQSMAAQPTRRGALSQDIIGRTQLRLAAVSSGSFVATLIGTLAPNLFGESLIEDAIGVLHQLLDAGDNAEALARQFAGLGPRAQNHYSSFVEHIAGSGAGVAIESQGATEGLRRSAMSESRAHAAQAALELLEREEQRQETLRGSLIGVRQERGDFEFREESSGDVVTGKIAAEAMSAAVASFNRAVSAVFSVETVSVRGAEEMTETWELTGVEPEWMGDPSSGEVGHGTP